MIKSPFLVEQRIFPVKLCQELADSAYELKVDAKYREPVKNDKLDSFIQYVAPQINSRYNTSLVQSTSFLDSYSTRHIPEIKCESTVHQNGMWFRNKDYDFETIVFLKEHVSNPPADLFFEVYGGKLEFPTFNFSFTPERGTAITFPCVPNFVNSISKVKLGQLDILRIFHRSATLFAYEPSDFKGDPSVWFSDLN